MSESETLTGATGQFAFTGLRAGSYTIEISGFDNEDVGFGNTSSTAQLAVGESRVVSFEGTYLRASAVMGQVSVEGTGLGGVTVSLQGKGETREMTTNGAGQFMFEDLRRGDYAIGISGYDDDEYGFDVTSKTVMVPYGETENVPFEGTALRTAEVRGTVTVEGMGPLDGVTVSLSGKGDDPDPVVTLGDGRFSFERLHAGDYTISIFGFDTDKYGFDVTSENVTVALKETAAVEFGGIMLRTAAIEGAVTVNGGALPGVTVTVSGGPKGEEHTATTNGAGMYQVDELHAGDYSVAISGYDTREYGFEVTTKPVSVGLRETADVAFDGILLRTAGVSGRVTVDGEAMSGLTVTLSGEEDRTGMTSSDGQYAFSGLAAGDYMLALSGYDEDEYEFPASMSVPLELDESAIANFMGRSLRTVVIMGTVSAEGDGIAGVGVTLIKVLSASSGEILDGAATGADGGYMFDELLAGTYRIDISGFDDEYHFVTKSRIGSVATDETAKWDFDATIIRTASVSGMVTVDDDGMADIMVTLSGDHGTDMDMETASDGRYAFEGLRKGSYTVSITNPDADMYDFPTMSRMVSLAVGQAQGDMSFAGSMLRRASISGQVHVEGDGLEGVMVTLDGDGDAEMMTDGNGEYNFPGLAGGDYEVEIENPDADAYTFEVMEIDVDDLGDEEAKIVDFEGEHTTTASISGVLFADELVNDGIYTEGEPMLPFGEFPLLLQGPGLDQVTLGATDATGAFSFDALKAGQYNLIIDLPGELKAALAKAGYAFSGRTITVVSVPAATDMDVNFPFRITKQTIYGGALLANKESASFPVGGVTMKLYPTAEDAEDGTNSLGSATTRSGKPDDPNTGIAEFEFDRADDTGPGGGSIDYLVYAKVTRVSNSDLKVHDDGLIEIEYEAVDRVTLAPATVKLINTRVNFQWWVKSNEDAKDGNRFLGGWEAKNGKETNSRGLATYSGTVTASQTASLIDAKPVRFTVEMDTDQADSVDMRELWTQSRALAHTHTGLENPAANTMANNDLGPIYVTWKTQSLVLGVYREADDVEGFTDFQSRLPGGDHRPVSAVQRGMEIKLLARDSKNRLKPYKYDHDACTNKDSDETDDREATVTLRGGLAKVSCLPADDEFTIKFDLGDDRVEIGVVEELGGYIEAYNEDDLFIGGTVIGTFGDEYDGGSGGVPEVRICLSSEGTSDDECATWGYQWETGSIVGNVGDQSGHRVTIAPTTENHGAEADTTNSRSEGAYELDELRDGVYDITAHNTSRYKVLGDTTQMVYVYHDETTDDDDTLTDYVGTAAVDTAKWSTRQLGLKIMGYIGNDVNSDSRFRGDESVAGITVKLTGGGLSLFTTTDERGFYKFENLEKRSYTITPSTSSYLVNRGYRTLSSGTKIARTTWSASAQDYPYSTLTEGDFSLPRWTSYTSRSISGTTSRVCDETDPPKCGTLYNFGLLYKDGQVEGGVNNLSGSASGIDLVWTDVFTEGEQEVTTNFRGEFTRTSLTEGDFTVKLEDAGWAVPKMRGSIPDDDGTSTAPSTVTGSLRGKDDFETMGMLHVYDAGASSGDAVSSSARVRGRTQGTNAASFDTAVSWRTGWSRASGTEETEGGNIGTISWKSESVSFYFGFRNSALSSDASVEVMKGSTVCASHRCVLDFNRTGRRDSTEVKETTLTVIVTAENGYDDHEYSLKVGRAAPKGHYKESTDIKVLKSDGTDSTVTATGDDPGTSIGTAWTLETRSSSASSVNVRIDLETLGDPEEDNAYCAQSIVVREYNDADTVKALNPPDEDNYEDDICRNTRYRLSAATRGTLYELAIMSEDSVSETYYLEVSRAGPKLSDDATLESLEVEPGTMTPAFDPETAEYTVNVTHDVGEVTATWVENDDEATSEADPGDSDAGTDGHQLELGARGTDTDLTITVTAEDGTELEYTITVHRPEEPVTDDATLSNLTIGEGTLTPPFEPGITEYTVGVPYDIEEVTAEWDEAHDEATSEGDPADADDATSGHQVELGDAGTETPLTITVTSEDESKTETYTVTVARAEAPAKNNDATLASLTLDGVDLNPGFDPAVDEYTAEVGPSVGTIEVMWETKDSNATTDPASSPHTFTLDDPGDRTDLTITVTAEDGETTKTYTVDVMRAKATDDAHLNSLTLKWNDDNGTVVILAIEKDETDYTTDVPAAVDQVEVMWTTNDEYATTDPAESPHTLELDDVGEAESLEITVTASDGETKRTYTLTVDRAEPTLSDDATLESLEVVPGNMSPAFDPETTEYTVNVTHDVGEVTATWVENDDEATSEADPADSDAGTDGHQLELGERGTDTDLTITVTAEDGTELEYSITVRRPEEPVTDDATLSNLTIGEGTLTPPFQPGITEYTVGVPYDIEEVTAEWDEAHDEATSEGDPADADTATSGHQVELGAKGTEITLTITVTAADGSTTEDYTVTVTRLLNDDATLSDLTVEPGTLDPAFSPGDTLYATNVEHDVEQVTVTWDKSDTNATTALNLSDADANTDGHQVTLQGEGETTRLTITVTAENGDTTQAYRLAVARAEGPSSNDATLDDLTVAGHTLAPSFSPDLTSYSMDVTHDVDEVSVTFTTTDSDATTEPAGPSHDFELGDAGTDTELDITVTAEDGTTTETYTITVTRAAAPAKNNDATLASLTLDGVDLNPGFDPAVDEYTAEVGPSVGTITVTWGTTDSNATTDPASSPHTFTLDEPGDRTDLTVTVTAEDGETTKTYTVEVKRAEETDDATLGSLEVKLYDDDGTMVELNPPFDPVVEAYRADVAHDVDSVEILWKTNDDYATTEPAASPYTLKTDPDLEDTESRTITVTASDGETKKIYTITVGRLLSDDATLSDLTVDPGTLAPDFDPGTTIYATSVEHDVEQVTVTWAVSHQEKATSVADPADANGQTDGHQLNLGDEGTDTDLRVTVTAEDGTEMDYTLTVTRAEAPPSDDATLSELGVTGQTLNPAFDPATMDYTAGEVAHDVGEVEVTFMKSDENATTDPAAPPYTATLNEAGTETDIEVTVTAQDGTTTETYTITVSRATAPGFVFKRGDAVVSEFTIDEGDTAIYSVELATPPDAGASVTVTLSAGEGITINEGGSPTFDATDPWNVPQNVEMSSVSDDNANQEDPVEITHTGSSSDGDYQDLADTLAVTLNEIHTKGVTVSSTGIEFVEGESNTYDIVLNSQPTGDVVVSVSGTRHDVTVNGGSSDLLNFMTGNWNVAQNVVVALAENTDTASYSAFDLTHRVVGADYDGIAVDDVEVQAMDDESPSVVVTRTAWSMNEETPETYNIQLTQAPGTDEVVTVRLIYNSGEFSVSYPEGGTAAVLNAGNWEAGINVIVTAVEVDSDVTRTLNHTVGSAGGDEEAEEVNTRPKYRGASASDITITVKDLVKDS